MKTHITTHPNTAVSASNVTKLGIKSLLCLLSLAKCSGCIEIQSICTISRGDQMAPIFALPVLGSSQSTLEPSSMAQEVEGTGSAAVRSLLWAVSMSMGAGGDSGLESTLCTRFCTRMTKGCSLRHKLTSCCGQRQTIEVIPNTSATNLAKQCHLIRTSFNFESYLSKEEGKWSFPCKTEKTAQEAKSIVSPVSSTPLNITHMHNTECIYFKLIMSKQFTPEVHSNLKFF